MAARSTAGTYRERLGCRRVRLLVSYELSEEQDVLLRTIATPFVSSGRWPVFGYAVAELDEHGMDARAVLRSLPRVPDPFFTIGRAGYGFTTLPVEAVQDDMPLGLTLAAGLVLPEMRQLFGEPFLRVLHQMIKVFRETPATPDRGKEAWVTSTEIAAALPAQSRIFWAALPSMLGSEPSTRRGSSNTGAEGSWKRELTREILRYKDVRSVEDYVTEVSAAVTEWANDFDRFAGRAVTAPPREQKRDVREESRERRVADRAKSARVLKVVPLDAAWLRFLMSDPPLDRIPNSVSNEIDSALGGLRGDVIDFLDTDLSKAAQNFIEALDALDTAIMSLFPPRTSGLDYLEVPPEWKYGKLHEQYRETIHRLSAARQCVLTSHKEMVNAMNDQGHLHPEEESSSPAIHVQARDNSPINVYASHVIADRGATANANINDQNQEAPPAPWWNRGAVLWTALGAVGSIGALAVALLE